MNIIQVCPYDLSIPGGVQTHINQLSNELASKNHNVMVFAPRPKKAGFDRSFDGEVRYITHSKRLGIWGTSIDVSILNREEKKSVESIISEFKPDVIHFHTIWNPFMQHQLLKLIPKGVKKVGTFHDTPPERGLGKWIGANLMRLASKYYLPKVDEIISVSVTQARAMGIDIQDAPTNFRVIPNGIEIKDFEPAPETQSERDEFKLIFVGRLEKRKGVPDLLHIYKSLQADPDIGQLSLDILGNGPESAQVDQAIHSKELEGITHIQNANDNQKTQLIREADLMIAPSLFGESFGIVLLEAMALGTKVVGYGNKGYLNIGKLYGVENFPKPGDRDALFEIIKKHITQSKTSSHLIRKGLEIAQSHDWRLLAKEIEKIYLK